MKLFSDPFYLNSRIGRLEYILSFLIYFGVGLVFSGLYLLVPGIKDIASFIESIIGFVLLLFMIAQGVKRCHDVGKSGWWLLIPFYFIWLFFAKGDEGENEYGMNPDD